MKLGPRATINLSALRHNLKIVKELAPSAKVVTVIKANAYGHGLLQVANALTAADMFAVARVCEGLQLREAGVTHRILILEGFLDESEVKLASQHQLELVIHQQRQIDLLEQAVWLQQSLQLWLKVDTGMHRLGIALEDIEVSFGRVSMLTCCQDRPVLMTHFANADDPSRQYTRQQIMDFNTLSCGVHAQKSLANSAAIIAWPDSHQDWVRPGIMLYGASPILGKPAHAYHLKPVMTLTSQLMSIKSLKKGDCIGYGSTWCCPENMRIGVVAIGYGDGYPRHAPSGTPVLINGQCTQLIGRVSMDMVTVDLRGIQAKEGDEAVLWGEGLPVEDIASLAGTISYELFCGITARVQFEYFDEATA